MDHGNSEELARELISAARRGEFHAIDELVEPLGVDQLHCLVGALAAVAASEALDISGPDAVCDVAVALAAPGFGTTPAAVLSKDRSRPVTDARAVAMTAARQNGLTITAIAEHFDKDHTSVIHAIRRTEADPRLEDAAAQITKQLKRRYTAALAQPSLRADAPAPEPVSANDIRLAALEDVASATAVAFGVAVQDLLGHERTRTLTDARAVAMSAARSNGASLPAIARHFACHHTSVLAAVRRVEQIPPHLALAARIAQQSAPQAPAPVTDSPSSYQPSDLIGHAVVASAERFQHLPEDLLGSSRKRPLADARAVAMAAARVHGETLTSIAREFGRDHSTVLSAVRRVENSPDLQQAAKSIAANLPACPENSADQKPASSEVMAFRHSPGARQSRRADTFTTPEHTVAMAR